MELDYALKQVQVHDTLDCSSYKRFLIAGDVSATNILLGIYAQTPDSVREVYKALYDGQKIPENGFNHLVLKHAVFHSGINTDGIERIVLAPAGPIEQKRRVQMTNAKFDIDVEDIGYPAILINDFAAKAYAVSGAIEGKINLDKIEMQNLLKMKTILPVVGEPIDIRGVGTGFGRARLYFENGRYVPKPSEGGHEFLVINSKSSFEVRLHSHLMDKLSGNLPHWEAVCSGQGLLNVYEFVLKERGINHPEDYTKSESPQKFIAEKAKSDDSSAEAEALYFMYKCFGRAIRNSSVSEIAKGGLYASGGMIKRDIIMSDGSYNQHLIQSFMEGFSSGPTHKSWAEKIPVQIMLDPEDGLKGALHVAQTPEFFERESYKP